MKEHFVNNKLDMPNWKKEIPSLLKNEVKRNAMEFCSFKLKEI